MNQQDRPAMSRVQKDIHSDLSVLLQTTSEESMDSIGTGRLRLLKSDPRPRLHENGSQHIRLRRTHVEGSAFGTG